MVDYLHFRSLHPKQWRLGPTVDEMFRELSLLATDAQVALGATTATWTHKPTFRVMKDLFRGTIDISAQGEDARIFNYVDQGTPAHPVEPKSPVSKGNPNRPSALSTRAGYRAKTTPGVLHSGSGGHYGAVVYKPGVWHPGVTPRYFIDVLQVRTQVELARRIPQAIERGLNKGIVQ